MPRGSPSAADQELLRALGEEGFWVSPFQLERWRLHKQLPPTVRHGLGRGRGSSSAYPEVALATARILAAATAQGRSRHYGTLAVFEKAGLDRGLWVDQGAVRAAFVWALKRVDGFVRRVQQSGPGGVDQMADKVRRRTTVYDPELLHLADPEHPTRSDRDRRAQARRRLAEERGITALALFGDPADLSADLVADVYAAGGSDMEELRDELRAMEMSEEEPDFAAMVQGPRDFIEMAKEMPFEQICAGRDAFMRCGAANIMIMVSAGICESARQFLFDWRATDLGRLFGTIRYSGDSPLSLVPGCIGAGFDSAVTVALDSYGAELLKRAMPYFVEMCATMAVSGGPETALVMGSWITRLTEHGVTAHGEDHWNSTSFRDAITALCTTAAGGDPDDGDPFGLIERLWGDLSVLEFSKA